jgi:hypothetical protein
LLIGIAYEDTLPAFFGNRDQRPEIHGLRAKRRIGTLGMSHPLKLNPTPFGCRPNYFYVQSSGLARARELRGRINLPAYFVDFVLHGIALSKCQTSDHGNSHHSERA